MKQKKRQRGKTQVRSNKDLSIVCRLVRSVAAGTEVVSTGAALRTLSVEWNLKCIPICDSGSFFGKDAQAEAGNRFVLC